MSSSPPSSASFFDVPTLPNTPEKQTERSVATPEIGPSFNDFIFHDKMSKSSVQMSTILAPIRIFIRVYEVAGVPAASKSRGNNRSQNNNLPVLHVSVSSFSQFQEETLL